MSEATTTSNKKSRGLWRRAAPLAFAGLFMAGVAVSLFSPFLTQKVGATGTSVELALRSNDYIQNLPYATCEPYFESVPKTPALLAEHFAYSDIFSIDEFLQHPEEWHDDTFHVSTKLGQLYNDENGNALRYMPYSQVDYLLNGVGSSQVPVIKFRQANTPQPGRSSVLTGAGVCESNLMLPVSNTEWRGSFLPANVGESGIYVRFVADNISSSTVRGKFNPVSPDSFYPNRTGPDYAVDVSIDGPIPSTSAPGSGTVNAINARWQNISTITMSGEEGGTYTKLSWSHRNGKSIYFLSGAGDTADATRTELINAPRCDDPFGARGQNIPVNACPEAGGRSNCVPFIAIDWAVWFSRNDNDDANGGQLNNLQSMIDGLGNAPARYYGYTNATECLQKGPTDGTPLNMSQLLYSKLWFAYSAVNDSFLSFFVTGDGNEVIYLGQYTKVAGAERIYQGGAGGCAGVITFGSTTPLTLNYFTVTWQLSRPNTGCGDANRYYGTVEVAAMGGALGEEAFNNTAPGVEPDVSVRPLEDERIGCDLTLNALSWIICPFVRGAMELVGLFDSLINQMLNIETSRIFDDTTDTGAAYHQAWRVFRTFALILIVIAALIMVIAQAAGLEILDAYTIKKLLPRLLIVSIGIALSWELMRFAVTLSNDLGHGVRGIIYAPFASLDSLAKLNAGSQFILILLGTGAILTYGIIGILSLVVTALLASLVAVALLAFREIGIVFLIIIAPLGIAAAILSFTQKLWKFWYNSFLGLLLVFVFISAFIAIGRVFSVTAATDSNPIYQLIAVIAYFAPYFMIPFAFKLAGGTIATVAGLVNDRSRGMFDRLKNFRAKTSQERMKRLGQGHLFNPESKLSRYLGGNAVNRVGAHVGAMRGPGGWRMGFGQKGQAKMANNAFAKYDQYASEDADFKAQVDNEDAMIAHAVGNNYQALAGLEWFQNADGSANDEKIRRAIAASSTIQMTGRSRAAALDAVAASGKIFAAGAKGRAEHRAVVQGMAGGNEMLRLALMGASQWRFRTSGGRQDVGRGGTSPTSGTSSSDDAWESLKETSTATLSSQKPWGIEGIVQDAMLLMQPNAEITEKGVRRKLTDAERQHLMDIIYAAQNNSYTNAYTQQEVSKVIVNETETRQVVDPQTGRETSVEVTVTRARDPRLQELVEQAVKNYRAKLGGGSIPPGGGGADAQAAAQASQAIAAAAAGAPPPPPPGGVVRPQTPPAGGQPPEGPEPPESGPSPYR